jgi:hypothetical protein
LGASRPTITRIVADLPTPLRILCRLTSGNRQLWHPAAPELAATPFCS